MQRESNTTGVKGGPLIRGLLICRFDAEKLAVESLHPFQILHEKHCAVQLHIRDLSAGIVPWIPDL